jgi:hypothetical protein
MLYFWNKNKYLCGMEMLHSLADDPRCDAAAASNTGATQCGGKAGPCDVLSPAKTYRTTEMCDLMLVFPHHKPSIFEVD